ncbi:flagellar protein FliT [Clostridium sp.]|uniref:flagellar protein FliT n=1 Tax=Clostridium sp. TaxID=1506 RepID=UPI0025C00A86|nr:flagellar protein FliT [Clostridium sp.]
MIDSILEEYKQITEKIIEIIDNDKEVIKFMEKREEILKQIFDLEVNIDVIKNLYLDKGILKLDNELKRAIENEKFKVKEEISKIHKLKNANNAYEKNKVANNFFNTKV